MWEGPDLRTCDVDRFLTGCCLRVQDFKVFFLDETRIPPAVPVCGRSKYERIKEAFAIVEDQFTLRLCYVHMTFTVTLFGLILADGGCQGRQVLLAEDTARYISSPNFPDFYQS